MLLTILLLGACATNGRVIETGTTGCEWARPIFISRHDVLTDPTARQILAHNETGRRLCSWSSSSEREHP
jgi:hypothetical protein